MIMGSVSGQVLDIKQPVLAGETINYITARFSFSPEWDGLVKVCSFETRDEAYDFLLNENDEITADLHVNLHAGVWTVALHGDTIVDGEITHRITTTRFPICIDPTNTIDNGGYPPIPPSIAAQILSMIGQLANLKTADRTSLVNAINEVIDNAFSGSYDDLTDKPFIPTALADLTQDSTHRVVTDAEKTEWDGKQDAISDLDDIRSGASLGATAVQPEAGKGLFSGSYTDLTNKPGAFAGATPTTPGASGFVPAPAAGDEEKVLLGSGLFGEMLRLKHLRTFTIDEEVSIAELYLNDGKAYRKFLIFVACPSLDVEDRPAENCKISAFALTNVGTGYSSAFYNRTAALETKFDDYNMSALSYSDADSKIAISAAIKYGNPDNLIRIFQGENAIQSAGTFAPCIGARIDANPTGLPVGTKIIICGEE